MPMTFTVRPSHLICLAAGFGLAAWLVPALPHAALTSPVAQARLDVQRQLTSGSVADRMLAPTADALAPTLDDEDVATSPTATAKRKGGDNAAPAAHADSETAMHRALRTSVAIRVGPSYGAGVLVSNDGLVLTVNHVLEDGKPVRVSVAGLPWREAKIVSRDLLADLALLKVNLPQEGPQRVAALGTVTKCQPGDSVFTIGSPASMHFSLTRGVLSFVGRRFGGYRYIQTDLPIQPGNSGGALFNEQGDVVGLMTFVLRNGQNLGFAMPIDYARSKFPELKALAKSADGVGFSAWAQSKIENPL